MKSRDLLTYGNCSEHFAVDEEIHSFAAALHFYVFDWIHRTIPGYIHRQFF